MNLLKKADRPGQTIGGLNRIPSGFAVPAAGIVVLICVLSVASRMNLNADLKNTRYRLERLEPQAAILRAAQASAAANRKTLSEFRDWSAPARPPMHSVLRALQKNIPLQMRLYHLSAGIEQTGGKAPLTCALRISGTANGEMTPVEARRGLNSNPELLSFCGELKLVSAQRHSSESWAFALEGRCPAEGDKE